MAILAKDTPREWVNAPEGLHQAVCVDVIDVGDVQMNFEGHEKTVHRVKIVWQINEMYKGKDFETGADKEMRYIFSSGNRYTLSLGKKANLRKDLDAWRGKAFTDEELKNGFDLENLIGANCQLGIVHRTTENGTYANMSTIAPLLKGMPKIEPLNYVRMKDRPNEGQETETSDDDDLPF
jgi:hypothetical protein